MNIGEIQAVKTSFTLEKLFEKYDSLMSELEQLEANRDTRLAWLARQMFPHILHPDYIPGKKVCPITWSYHTVSCSHVLVRLS